MYNIKMIHIIISYMNTYCKRFIFGVYDIKWNNFLQVSVDLI